MTSRKIFPRETLGIHESKRMAPGTVPDRPAGPAIVVTDKTKHTIHPTPPCRYAADPDHVGEFSRGWDALRAKPTKGARA